MNLFLQGYEKSWIEAEEHYFEDKLIEDLAVSLFSLYFDSGRISSSSKLSPKGCCFFQCVSYVLCRCEFVFISETRGTGTI